MLIATEPLGFHIRMKIAVQCMEANLELGKHHLVMGVFNYSFDVLKLI